MSLLSGVSRASETILSSSPLSAPLSMAGQQAQMKNSKAHPLSCLPVLGAVGSFQSHPLLLLLPSPQPILHCEEKQVRTHHQVRSHWSASFRSPHSLRSRGSGGKRVVFLIHVIHTRNLTDTYVGEHKLRTSCHGSGHRCRGRNRVT